MPLSRLHVVTDDEHGAGEGGHGGLELLGRVDVEVVGRLVEHEGVDLTGREDGEHGPGALTHRQGPRRPRDVGGAETELREQRPHLRGLPALAVAGPARQGRLHHVEHAGIGVEQ